MLEIGYLLLFWIVACVFIIFKSIKVEELNVESESAQKLANSTSTLIKGVPAILAALFVVIMRPDDSLFFFGVAGALLFCFAGDLGMEKDLLIGLPLFLIAQLLFATAFFGQAITIGPSVEDFALTAAVSAIVVVYMVMFLRYLESSEAGLGEFKIPVIAYCVVISLMFISSVLLWSTSGKLEVIVVALGALIFVISDSIIAIHEFHHKISGKVLKVMATYYSAIFLLSLSVIAI
ncbi:MAG: lysoplasmalogenase [Candidatus Heimdallarchaeota archaeon]